MRKYILFIICLGLFPSILPAQTGNLDVTAPEVKDFAGTLLFLSSDWMEGREAGTRGSFMAADFIAVQMQMNGLVPYGDPFSSKEQVAQSGSQQSWFQDFKLIRYQAEKTSLSLLQRSEGAESVLNLSQGIDFECHPALNSTEDEASLIFAGYGISAPEKGYDDYAGLDLKGKIVVVLDGFPGRADTTSLAWKKLGKYLDNNQGTEDWKIKIAEKRGAIALMVVTTSGNNSLIDTIPVNHELVAAEMDSAEITEPEYRDGYYTLPGDTSIAHIPCFTLSLQASSLFFTLSGIDIARFESEISGNLVSLSHPLSDIRLKFSIIVKAESLAMRNVLGRILGKDTTRSIIVGAHYDHLGMRDGIIYRGADDNASGVAGMLALGKTWAGIEEQPPCNIVFAAWTAEEKGEIGSQYFVEHIYVIPDQVLVSINMDMISRSAPDDTARRQLSVGTLPISENLRQIAVKANQSLAKPFELDLWDVSGHSGSDYTYFAAVGIPIMTFFSGFHDDYHTSRDIAAKADLQKMNNILNLVNCCIWQILKSVIIN